MNAEIKTGTACNNNCIFCLNEQRGIFRKTEEIKREIDALSDNGVTSISFTGGETSIRPDFFELISYAKRRGCNVSIQTNGRAFS
jgi:MoaA/NifB/PqqE/SkfB family radical SAM enzyme